MGQRKYPIELRDRATRMTLEALADPAGSRGAIKRIAEQLAIDFSGHVCKRPSSPVPPSPGWEGRRYHAR